MVRLIVYICLAFICILMPLSVLAQPLNVFVSILPQQYFVERIGGDQVRVRVMVKPGQSPETFEPSPRLMAQYSSADVYFTIGLPFEQVWIKRLASLNAGISVVNTRPEQQQLLQASHQHEHASEHNHEYKKQNQRWDPHTWLSPVLAIEQARIINLELSRLMPDKKAVFENNFKQLLQQLKDLDQTIAEHFAHTNKHEFLTFHPAFSYFAHRYGLIQRAIEIDGKEPSAKQIARQITALGDKKVPAVLIEQQFNTVIAKTIARSLNAQLLSIDPLAYDYIKNMQDIADKVSRSLF